MPYLNSKFREELLENGFSEYANYMLSVKEDGDWAGAINYSNYVILKERMNRDFGRWTKYWKLALWVGTMVCCIFEVYRRVIAKYEDKAIERNGDV